VKWLALLLLFGACSDPEIRYPKGGGDRACTRPIPQKLFKRSLPHVRSVRFRRLSRFSARETVRLSGNILLRVKHAGCARVGQTFRFLLPALEKPKGDRRFWYNRAASLLRQASSGTTDPRGLVALAEAIERQAGSPPPYGKFFPAGSYQKLAVKVRAVKRGRQTEVVLSYAFAY
jgi:hypothetical protein